MHPSLRLLSFALLLGLAACGDKPAPPSPVPPEAREPEPDITPTAAPSERTADDPAEAPTDAQDKGMGLATHFKMDGADEPEPPKEVLVTDKGPYQVEIAAETPASVVQAREGKAGDEVVVAGRVKEIVKGFAAFKLIDDSLKWCGREEDCGCETPWDYCCEDVDAVRGGTMAVELRDAEGNPVEAAKLGLRVLDLVVVKGRLEGTEAGGLVIVTDKGWDLRSRPDLGIKEKLVEWPE